MCPTWIRFIYAYGTMGGSCRVSFAARGGSRSDPKENLQPINQTEQLLREPPPCFAVAQQMQLQEVITRSSLDYLGGKGDAMLVLVLGVQGPSARQWDLAASAG